MRYLPLFVDLQNRPVLVVGGGTIAERKIDLLLQAGAKVTLVAPTLTQRLTVMAAQQLIMHRAATFAAADLDGQRFVIAATDDDALNASVAAAAEARHIFANIVDDRERSTAILPAIIDRSPVMVAVSTGGASPVLARLIRERIESTLDESLGRLAALCERWRARIKGALPDLKARRRFYTDLLRGRVADLVRQNRDGEAEELLATSLAPGSLPAVGAGVVTLVGAGPGDVGLLTLKAFRALQEADVVLHDRLVSPAILQLARREAEIIEVGKQAGVHRTEQQRINELLVELARTGRRVVRLKGGDPFVFGRGGEELQHLQEQGVAFEVIPGITAAVACAAYAGIPLTHRDHAGSVRFVTAHCRESIDAIDWRALRDPRETLAVYMGVSTLAQLSEELLRHGRATETPVAFVENGSRPEQRVILGTLGNAAETAAKHGVVSPALLFVGPVAALAEQLHWFGAAPIANPSSTAALVSPPADTRSAA